MRSQSPWAAVSGAHDWVYEKQTNAKMSSHTTHVITTTHKIEHECNQNWDAHEGLVPCKYRWSTIGTCIVQISTHRWVGRSANHEQLSTSKHPNPYLRTSKSQHSIARRLATNGFQKWMCSQKIMLYDQSRALHNQSFDRRCQLSKSQVAQKDDDELTDGWANKGMERRMHNKARTSSI